MTKSKPDAFDFEDAGPGVGQCEMCGGETFVKDSRPTFEGVIRRRRQCKFCDEAFTTYESRRNPVALERKLKVIFNELQVLAKVKRLLGMVNLKEVSDNVEKK